MAIACYKKLTLELYSEYVGRKGDKFSFFINTNNNCFYMVPLEMEHIAFASFILGVAQKDIESNPAIASHLVPVVLLVNTERTQIAEYVIGNSSLEMLGGVRHTKEQLVKAQLLTRVFLTEGELPLKAGYKEHFVTRWAA